MGEVFKNVSIIGLFYQMLVSIISKLHRTKMEHMGEVFKNVSIIGLNWSLIGLFYQMLVSIISELHRTKMEHMAFSKIWTKFLKIF